MASEQSQIFFSNKVRWGAKVYKRHGKKIQYAILENSW